MNATHLHRAQQFRALHDQPGTFVIPNPWDAGTARILTSLGFQALATTSAGLAWSLGGADSSGLVTREAALANARAICAATPLPVSADLENLYAHEPEAAAQTVPLAAEAGLCGCSIEDYTGNPADPIYPLDAAVARVKAAVAAARALPMPFVLTARAENLLHGRVDLADTIRRLQAFEAAGADVLYAPGLATMDQVRQVLAAVNKPINVLVSGFNAQLTLAELADAGVKRISVGGALARAALGEFIRGAQEIASAGTFSYATRAPKSAEVEALLSRA